jgi:hypothetical protein
MDLRHCAETAISPVTEEMREAGGLSDLVEEQAD